MNLENLCHEICSILTKDEALMMMVRLAERYEELAGIIRDMVPYAETAIGSPRSSWPYDNVILRAERALGEKL